MLKTLIGLVIALGIVAPPLAAQSPNNAGIVVVVTDQSGLVIKDATVSLTNNQTGAVRHAVSGSDGSASFPGLSLTGTYTLSVTKQGFADETRKDMALRSGETATLRVKLLVAGEASQDCRLLAPTR